MLSINFTMPNNEENTLAPGLLQAKEQFQTTVNT